jgi:MFS family permease
MRYAWFMVGITFLTQFLCMGVFFYSAGVFLVPLQQEFDVGRAPVALIGTVTTLGAAMLAPFIGRWVARSSIRNIMSLGCLAMGVGLLVGSRATEIWHLIVLFGMLVSFSLATMCGVTAQALVINWFKENRTMALGISMVGISASGAIIPPIAQSLVESGGWRWAYQVFGWTSLCLIPLVFFTVVGRPEERGERAGVGVRNESGVATPPELAMTTWEALRQRNLWVIAVACGLAFMVLSAALLHIPAHATDLGFTGAQGASFISVIAICSAIAKIAFGWLARKIGEQYALQVAFAMMAVGTLGLNFEAGIAPMLVTVAVMGLGLGGIMPLCAAVLARAFGSAAFGPMMGLLTLTMIPFQSIGQPIAGWVFDTMGSYTIAWFGFSAVMLVAMATLTLLRLPDEVAVELASSKSDP